MRGPIVEKQELPGIKELEGLELWAFSFVVNIFLSSYFTLRHRTAAFFVISSLNLG